MKHLILSACAAALLVACSGQDDASTKTTTPVPPSSVTEPHDSPTTTTASNVINSEADVPRVDFKLTAKPSALVAENGEALGKLRTEVEAHVDDILQNYDIQDATFHKQMLGTKKSFLVSRGDFEKSFALTQEIKALEDKQAAKATSGLMSDAYSRAQMKVGSDDGEAFRTAYRGALKTALAPLDADLVRNDLQSTLGQMRMMTPTLIDSALKSQFDAMAENMDMTVDASIATALVSLPMALDRMRHSDIAIEELDAFLSASPEAAKEDLWAKRDVTVTSGTETVIAIWDTGVDPKLQGERMWVNPDSSALNRNGLAYSETFEPETGELFPEAGEYVAKMDTMMDLMKGSLDLTAGLNSDEAQKLTTHLASIDPDDLDAFQKEMAVLGNYIHGQHVADIAAEGNAAAKIMNIRMSWPTDPIPTDPFDEAFAEGLVRAAQQSVAFMKKNDVKVVNMSWRITRPAIEGSLMITGAEPDSDKRKARAAKIFDSLRDGLEMTFASAPDILFVAGAGNEDEDVEFVQSVPAGINLPNVITVGAVDEALQPAGFTSFGKSIDIYTNGFEIPARVPGGRVMKLSGTSMAAPNLANIAGKLWATNPDLTVAEVRVALEGTATQEGDLPVADAKAAMAKIKG